MCMDCNCRFSTIEISLEEYRDLKDMEETMTDMILRSKGITDKLNSKLITGGK